MTTTPETPEQIVSEQIECRCPERLLSDEDIYSADCPRHDHFPEFMKIARAAGLLVGAPTKGQIEAAAREYHERRNGEGSFDRLADHVRSSLLFRMGCALRAADVAPQAHANPVYTSAGSSKIGAISFNVAPQEPSEDVVVFANGQQIPVSEFEPSTTVDVLQGR